MICSKYISRYSLSRIALVYNDTDIGHIAKVWQKSSMELDTQGMNSYLHEPPPGALNTSTIYIRSQRTCEEQHHSRRLIRCPTSSEGNIRCVPPFFRIQRDTRLHLLTSHFKRVTFRRRPCDPCVYPPVCDGIYANVVPISI